MITMTVSDDFPSSMTASFTVTVTNAAPKVVIVPGDVSLVHGGILSIPLASNFADDDGDAITMTAAYSLSGGTALMIPNGIFTVPSAFTIGVESKSIADTGVYAITLTVSDPQLAFVTQTFTVTVTNAAPRIDSPPPSQSVVHGNTLSIPLASYFTDDDGDVISMTATYSLNGGLAQAIPGGLLS
jgi:hypothetical protein